MPKRKRARPPQRSLTPTLRDQFHLLLVSWPRRQVRGDTPPVSWPPNPSMEQFLLYEEQYGDGHFAAHREEMDDLLNKVEEKGRADFGALYPAYAEAWAASLEGVSSSRSIDVPREMIEERDRLRRNAISSLQALWTWMTRLDPWNAACGDSAQVRQSLQTIEAVSSMLTILRRDP